MRARLNLHYEWISAGLLNRRFTNKSDIRFKGEFWPPERSGSGVQPYEDKVGGEVIGSALPGAAVLRQGASHCGLCSSVEQGMGCEE